MAIVVLHRFKSALSDAMAPLSAKSEGQKKPLTPSQSKAKRLIEELTEKTVEVAATEEGNLAKEFLQGIWNGNAIPNAPCSPSRKEGNARKASRRIGGFGTSALMQNMQTGMNSEETNMSHRMSRITPIVPTNDIEISGDFYTKLGFDVIRKHEDYTILQRDDIDLHLTWSEGWHIDPKTNDTQFRIKITDLDPFYAHCQNLDVVHPNGQLETKPWGSREFTVLDPDNACITFYEEV